MLSYLRLGKVFSSVITGNLALELPVLGGLAALQAPAAVPAAIGIPLAAVLTCTLPAAVNRKPGGD